MEIEQVRAPEGGAPMEFVRADRPRQHPGHTVSGSQQGPVVNCGEIGGYGTVYHGERDVRLMMRALRFPLPERHERLQQLAAVQRARIAELEAALAEAEGRDQIKVVSLDDARALLVPPAPVVENLAVTADGHLAAVDPGKPFRYEQQTVAEKPGPKPKAA